MSIPPEIQPWEYFQQLESGDDIDLPLWWVCGASVSFDRDASGSSFHLTGLYIYALPFELLRDVTASKISIRVRTAHNGAAARIGIYNTFSLDNNKPTTLVVDGGEIDLSSSGVKTANLNTTFAPGRYWAALLTNDSIGGTGGTQIDGIPLGNQFYWGSKYDSSNSRFDGVTHVVKTGQTYGGLPSDFPTLTASDYKLTLSPAIALAFSDV